MSDPVIPTPVLTVVITAGVSAVTAIIAVVVTYVLTRKREHEAEWRKLKFGQYQEFVLALSGVVRERSTPEAQRRYADAVNSMSLAAPTQVLAALRAFQDEIKYTNTQRRDEREEMLLDALFRVMRDDIHPNRLIDSPSYTFRMQGLPPEKGA